jgi:hypothetical protein
MTTDAATIAEIESALPRPAKIDSTNRNQIRRWLTASGIPYATAGRLTVTELAHAYNTAGAQFALTINSSDEEQPELTPQPQPERKPTPTPAPMTTTPATDIQNAAAALAAALAATQPQHAPIDEPAVIALIQQHAPRPEPREISIRINDAAPKTIARQHYKFPLLLACAAARVPAFLVGPAGTGKTTSAHAAAQALELHFSAMSIGPMTSKSDFYGLRDANGTYHKTDLVRLAESGGVFLFDEFDAGHPGVLTLLNMLLANGHFSTPAGLTDKHADFVPIMALNTYGTGASRQYVGRMQLDAATLDRGAFIDWNLDEGLESSFLGIDEKSPSFDLAAGHIPTPEEWLKTVRAFRAACESHKLQTVTSPRAALLGCKLAAAGVGNANLREMLLFRGMDKDARAKIAPALAHLAA